MLPKEFEPNGTYDLLRLGKDFDGGYLVERQSLARSSVLFSFGLSDDWSFEIDFVRHTNARVEAFDHTISARVFRRRLLKAMLRPQRIRSLARAFDTWTSYRRFFSQHAKHHRIMVGYSGPGSKSAREIIGAATGVFLKIDIEGWEYRILEELIELAPRLEGVVIELHDVDLHRDRIRAFIRDFPLNLCHIHSNNCGGMDAIGDPLVVEMTFSQHSPLRATRMALPHALDMANNPSLADIPVVFASDTDVARRSRRKDHAAAPDS